MAFALFMMLTGTLFLRPAEVVPQFQAWPIYQVLILGCLVLTFTPVLRQLDLRILADRPMHAAVLGMWAAIGLSHFSHMNLWSTRYCMTEFSKVVIYYFVLVSILTTMTRIRTFLMLLVAFIVGLTVLAVLQYHGRIDIPALTVLQEADIDPETGEVYLVPRMRSTGLFNDPNDLATILVTGVLAASYFLTDRQAGFRRLAWLAPIAIFVYALVLTKSRGGLLGLVIGILVVTQARFGWRKAALLVVVGMPMALLALGGNRQTDFSGAIEGGTGQSRIQLWSEGLGLFRSAPLFGIGQNEFSEEVGYVAHNSFVHCYAELGFFGGTVFLGAFFYCAWALYRLRNADFQLSEPGAERLRPFLLAIVVAYFANLLSLSRAYTTPTYLVLGLCSAYLWIAEPYPYTGGVRLSQPLLQRVATISCVFLICTYLFVKVSVRW